MPSSAPARRSPGGPGDTTQGWRRRRPHRFIGPYVPTHHRPGPHGRSHCGVDGTRTTDLPDTCHEAGIWPGRPGSSSCLPVCYDNSRNLSSCLSTLLSLCFSGRLSEDLLRTTLADRRSEVGEPGGHCRRSRSRWGSQSRRYAPRPTPRRPHDLHRRRPGRRPHVRHRRRLRPPISAQIRAHQPTAGQQTPRPTPEIKIE
jgi:hypothetical protein